MNGTVPPSASRAAVAATWPGRRDNSLAILATCRALRACAALASAASFGSAVPFDGFSGSVVAVVSVMAVIRNTFRGGAPSVVIGVRGTRGGDGRPPRPGQGGEDSIAGAGGKDGAVVGLSRLVFGICPVSRPGRRG